MGLACTRCESTGFLNLHQIPELVLVHLDSDEILKWISDHENHDVQVCDCCGDGDDWYHTAGEHYNGEEREGVYDYNGGLCECH